MQDKYKIGQISELHHVFDTKSVLTFSEISTDKNPIHIDEKFATDSLFGKRIVHGILVASLFSAIIANKVPGPGSIYLSQELIFKKPVFHNEEVIAKVEIINIREDKPIITLRTTCYNLDGDILIDGKAVIKKI